MGFIQICTVGFSLSSIEPGLVGRQHLKGKGYLYEKGGTILEYQKPPC